MILIWNINWIFCNFIDQSKSNQNHHRLASLKGRMHSRMKEGSAIVVDIPWLPLLFIEWEILHFVFIVLIFFKRPIVLISLCIGALFISFKLHALFAAKIVQSSIQSCMHLLFFNQNALILKFWKRLLQIFFLYFWQF